MVLAAKNGLSGAVFVFFGGEKSKTLTNRSIFVFWQHITWNLKLLSFFIFFNQLEFAPIEHRKDEMKKKTSFSFCISLTYS